MAAFGAILAAKGHPTVREWRLESQQMAAAWHLNGSKWQRNGSRVGGELGVIQARVSDARDYNTRNIA
jgi:hypothetical protein